VRARGNGPATRANRRGTRRFPHETELRPALHCSRHDWWHPVFVLQEPPRTRRLLHANEVRIFALPYTTTCPRHPPSPSPSPFSPSQSHGSDPNCCFKRAQPDSLAARLAVSLALPLVVCPAVRRGSVCSSVIPRVRAVVFQTVNLGYMPRPVGWPIDLVVPLDFTPNRYPSQSC
jgi:hypothetical protein